MAVIVSAIGVGAGAGVYSRLAGVERWTAEDAVPADRVARQAGSATGDVEIAQSDVAAQADPLESRLRNYRVRLTADGLLPGRMNLFDVETNQIRTLSNVTISLIQNGEVKATATPGEGGVFQVAGLTPGVYALVGAGPAGYVAFGVDVVAHKAEGPAVNTAGFQRRPGEPLIVRPAFYQEVETTLDIDSLAVPRRDFGVVIQLVRSYVPPSVLSASPGTVPEIAEPGAEIDEPEPTEADAPTTAMQRHVVEIGPDGTLEGRTRRLHPQTGKPTRLRRLNVFLVRDNAIVGQSPVSEAGTFSFRGVTPGAYSFVASGLEGFAAFSVQAVPAEGVTRRGRAREWIVPVAMHAAAASAIFILDGALVGPENIVKALEELLKANGREDEVAELRRQFPNADEGGVLGGGGGGGGFGGGAAGGDLSGLLTGLIGAAAGAALASGFQDNAGNTIVTVTTPSLP